MYAFTQDVPIDESQYRVIMAALGPEPLDGQLLHLCVRREDGGLRYIDIWESEQKCGAAFEGRIHAAVDTAFGGSRPGEPVVNHLEVLHATGSVLPATATVGGPF
jgi:hypothetical protein